MKGKDTDKSVNKTSMPREKTVNKSGSSGTLMSDQNSTESSAHKSGEKPTAPPKASANTQQKPVDNSKAGSSAGPKPAGKAKAKTNKVCDDYQQRLERVEGLLARLVDTLEQPVDNDYEDVQHGADMFIRPDDINISDSEEDVNIPPPNKATSDDQHNAAQVILAADKPATDTQKQHVPNKVDSEDMGFAAKYADNSQVGKAIDDKLAISVKYLMGHKLQEKAVDDAVDKYPAPSNCEILDVPRVRPAIWDTVMPSTRSKDLKLQRVQKPLTKGITAFTRTIDPANTTDEQQDIFALLCNANFELNMLRRETFKPEMNPKYLHLCKPSNPVTKWLFGDNLSAQVKDLTEEQKTTAGVLKKSSQHRYQPYPTTNRSRQRFVDAGWLPSRGNFRQSSHARDSGSRRLFLGQQQRLNLLRRRFQRRNNFNKKTATQKKTEQ